MTHLLLSEVRSGGQDGIDIAALRAAKALYLPTAGTLPAGWRTHSGSRPAYAALYGCTMDPSPEWAPRTRANVAAADCTIRLALRMDSSGERCTLDACRREERPHFDIRMVRAADGSLAPVRADVEAAVTGVRDVSASFGRPVRLNVAGNSERTTPGIEAAGEAVLRVVLLRMATGLRVRTARISYRGEDRLDVTRKSGGVEGVVFAPSWAILKPALDARAIAKGADAVTARGIEEEAWARYVPAYTAEMRASWMANREAWERLLLRPIVTLVCYCTDAAHCHRRLLAAMLDKLGAVDGREVTA